MSYKIFDITTKKETSYDIANCTIMGNTTAYELKDGKIFKYSIMDNEIDRSTEQIADRLELTNYQKKFLDKLKDSDGNGDVLDKKDLKNLNNETFKQSVDSVYSETPYYVSSVAANKNEASVSLQEKGKDENKQLKIKFEKIGFWKTIGNAISNFFKWVGSLFSSAEEDTRTPFEKEFASDKLEQLPEEIRVVTDEDEHNPITLCNDLGISYSRLKMANPDLDLTKPLETGMEIKIPRRASVIAGTVQDAASTAEAAGVSENYVKDILLDIEGNRGVPALGVYDDKQEKLLPDGRIVKIKSKKKIPKGTLTIGFGHTGRVFGQIMTRENRDSITITHNQAHELLVSDIISAKADAIEYFGEDFVRAPQSIQDAITDIIFNKGLEKGLGIEKFEDCLEQTLTPQIKTCLANGDYAGCISKLIYQTGLKGLKKRNYYRLISAMQDLSPTERTKAMKDIEYYYKEVANLYKDNQSELDYINRAWKNAQKGICSGFFS